MGVTSGEITFLVFYTAFLFIIATLIGYMDLAGIEGLHGLTEAQLEALGSSSIDPFTFFNKMFILTTVSSDFQMLSFLLAVFTIPAAFIILKAILDALPFF